MNFNKTRCLKSLKERKEVRKKSPTLWYSNRAKSKQLSRYLDLLNDQIFWQNRRKYCQMLDLFISTKISIEDFFDQFYHLRASDLKASRVNYVWNKRRVFEIQNQRLFSTADF